MRELAPGVHSLGGSRGGRVRAFLVESAGELTLVDTLFHDDAREVLAALRTLGRSTRDMKRIVLTHAHRSHLGGVAALAFHLPEHRLLIAGDAIVTWPRFEAGWRAFTLNPVQQRASLAHFAALEPRIVAVGHGDEVTEDAAAKVHAFAERP